MPGLCVRIVAPPLAAGHLDTCESRNAARTLAHERVRCAAVTRVLCNVAGAEVEKEPTIRSGQTRKDVRLRLVAGAASPLPSIDIDVSVKAASSKMAPSSEKDTNTPSATAASIQATLNVPANRKRAKQADPTAFLPFIISAGGVLLADTEKAVAGWRKYVPPSAMGYLLNRIADALLNRRLARN